MKTLINILILCCIPIIIEAQDYSYMNKAQLDLALKNAQHRTNVGIALTVFGVLMGGTGVVYTYHGTEPGGTGGEVFSGVVLTIVGLGLMGVGIPTWLSQSNKKNNINVELLKSNLTGFRYQNKSGPIYGLTLKITF